MDILLIASTSLLSVAFIFTAGRFYERSNNDRKKLKELENEAQDIADIPLTDDDFVNRMLDRIKRKNKT